MAAGQTNVLGGEWVKPGQEGSNPQTPGSYGQYGYVRDSPSEYQTLDQQQNIADAGRQVKEECEGKNGADFRTCRADVLDSQF